MKTPARVDLKTLLTALADPSPDVMIYIDSHSGEVARLSRSAPIAELTRFKAQSDRDPDRYVKAPRPTAEETYSDMTAFVGTVKDKKLQDRLQLEIRGGGTLRNFVDTLLSIPTEKERWHRFRDDRVRGRLQSWLRSNGLGAI